MDDIEKWKLSQLTQVKKNGSRKVIRIISANCHVLAVQGNMTVF